MLILERVKVLCFDTLLQVLILKVVTVAGSAYLQPLARCDPCEVPEARGRLGKQRVATQTIHPPPGCFGKRGRKRLKTKDGSCKRRSKRLQEIERARVTA